MTHHHDNLRDAELGPVIDRLQAERPTASALELDAIARRVHRRVGRAARRSGRTEFMRSRLAIVGMLMLGMVMSTGGAGLAVSGFASQSGNAAQQQYGTTPPAPGPAGQPGGDVLGEEETGAPAGGQGENAPSGGQGEQGTAGEQGDNAVQPARQVESGAQGGGGDSGQLPFTGFAAIPILLGGVALLSTGLVLRRRSSDDA